MQSLHLRGKQLFGNVRADFIERDVALPV